MNASVDLEEHFIKVPVLSSSMPMKETLILVTGVTLFFSSAFMRKAPRQMGSEYRDRKTSGSKLRQAGLIAVHGTLIVALATNKGLVVCADKRTNDAIRGDLDSKLKIIQAAPSTLITVTGHPTFYDILDNRTLNLAFSAEDLTKSYFLKQGLYDNDEFWRNLAYRLKNEFEQFLYARPFRFWPETGDPPDNALFVIGVFHLDKARGPQAAYIRFSYIKSERPIITIRRIREPEANFTSLKPIMLGNLAVYNETTSGQDKRFDDMRSDKLLRHFLHDRPAVKTVSVASALDFSRKFIKLTSERTSNL
jgi:hypothetical protein